VIAKRVQNFLATKTLITRGEFSFGQGESVTCGSVVGGQER
jgi:hypothetical protein